MRFDSAAVVLALATYAFGAGCPSPEVPPFTVGLPQTPQPSTTCPFGVRGARVRMSNTEDGVLVSLRAYGDLAEVRQRARDAAAMYGPGAHRGLGHAGRHGGGHQHGLGLARLGVPVQAEAEDTPDGARIIVRPRSASDLEPMRKALWAREGQARAGECP